MSKLADELRGIKSRTVDPVLGPLVTFGDSEGVRERAADALDAAEKALREVLSLPIAQEGLKHLRRGFGKKTPLAVWSRAEAALARLEGK